MESIFVRFIFFCLSVLYFTYVTNGITLSESEQISLEVSGLLLPSPVSSKIVKDHLIEIRRLYPAVSKISHDAKWIPGQLIIPTMTESDIIMHYWGLEGNLKSINESEYGPVKYSNPGSIYPDLKLKFSKPYNPEILGEIMEEHFNLNAMKKYNYIPYNSTNPIRNIITCSDLYPWAQKEGVRTRVYTIKKAWKLYEEFYSHFWVFKIKNEHNKYVVTFENEYGDNLIE